MFYNIRERKVPEYVLHKASPVLQGGDLLCGFGVLGCCPSVVVHATGIFVHVCR